MAPVCRFIIYTDLREPNFVHAYVDVNDGIVWGALTAVLDFDYVMYGINGYLHVSLKCMSVSSRQIYGEYVLDCSPLS